MKFTSGNLHLVFVSTPNLDEKAAFPLDPSSTASQMFFLKSTPTESVHSRI